MRNGKHALPLFSTILFCTTLFFSHHVIAQTNIYVGDTSNVSVAIESIDGINDIVYILKHNKKRNGTTALFYDKTLKIKAMECTYRRGKHQGTDRYFYPNGAVKKKAEVQEGWFSDSIFAITSDTSTEFLRVDTYWAKRNCGEYNFWFPSGQIRCQGTFKRYGSSECTESGQWYFWYADGNVKKVVTYSEFGLKHGTYKEYYKTGKIKLEGTYHADVSKRTSYKHDIWKVYDLEGNLIREIRYLLGMKVSEK